MSSKHNDESNVSIALVVKVAGLVLLALAAALANEHRAPQVNPCGDVAPQAVTTCTYPVEP